MDNLINKLKGIRHLATIIFLWTLGFGMLLSQNYGFIMKGLLLTDKEIVFESVTYLSVSSFGILFIVAGRYLNRFLDKFTNNDKE